MLPLAVAVILVAAGVTIWYSVVHQPKGTVPTGAGPAPYCRLSPDTLAQSRTHNPTGADQSVAADVTTSRCTWEQTAGTDGVDPRTLRFSVLRYTGPKAEQLARDGYQAHRSMPHGVQPAQTTEVGGIGDQAARQTAVQRGGTATVTLIARRGSIVLDVTCDGADQGFLWTFPMPFDEGERITRLVAVELLGRP